MTKRILALFVLCALLCTAMLSCSQAPASTQEPEASTVGKTTQPPKDILFSSQSNLHIIYPQDAQSGLIQGADTLFNALLSRLTIRATVSDDSADAANAIHLGLTDEISAQEAEGLRLKDFRILARDGKLFLLGGSPEATEDAVQYFLSEFVKRGEDQLVLPGDTDLTVRYEYPINDTRLNGADLREYTVRIPEESSLFTRYAAQNLVDFVKINLGIALPIATGEPTDAKEILIDPDTDLSFEADQYTLYTQDQDLLLDAEGYMVGAAVGELIHAYLIPAEERELPTQAQLQRFAHTDTKNTILLIGDGMGINHIEAVKKDRLDLFCAEVLPYQTECTTYSESVTKGSAEYTDSAASATALATGTKTLNGFIGMDSEQNALTNAREYAQQAGAKTAVLTTDEITGATPAGFLAHVNERTKYSQIQNQIDQLTKEGKVDFAEGSLGDTLTLRSAEALHSISSGEGRFFAMIEEGIIDKNSHNNDYEAMLDTVERMNDLVAYVIEFTLCHPDTALFITADHETGGLTYDEGRDGFVFTSGNHTNANVKLFMMGKDAEEFTKETVDNTDIGSYLCDLYR